MNSLRVLAIALISSVALYAAGDFDLPSEIESVKPAEFAPIETDSASDTIVPDLANTIAVSSEPANPVTSTPANNGNTTPAAIVAKKIPTSLNRPVRVGVYTDEKTLFVKYNGEEFSVSAKNGKIKIEKGKSTKTENFLSLKQSGRCTSIAPDKKTLKFSCFPGDFKITAKGNTLTAINSVSVEEYLRGVIPYEIGKLDSSRFSALEAQAIAARTYAYKHFGSRESLGFDIFADTKDQVYKGLASATSLTDSAVKKTAGIVMTYNGEFIIAYYHSTCGGETETLATWERENLPYLQSKPDLRPDGTPWCNESSYTSWERKFSDKETVSLFKQNAKETKAKITNFSSVYSISILDTLPSGRILTLEINTDKGTYEVVGDKVRWLFKKNGAILPSSFFRIGHDDNGWVIQGKGFGHGVGLCQMGVRARAAAGQDFATILNHYYTGITLERFEK